VKSILLILALLLYVPAYASNHSEKYYQRHWCVANQGKMEVMLADSSRVDCVTPTHAVEFDFAEKWAEAIGQSLYYSTMTGKYAGIVLIVERPNDRKLANKAAFVIEKHNLPIKLWIVP
jgi:hypothetical protein